MLFPTCCRRYLPIVTLLTATSMLAATSALAQNADTSPVVSTWSELNETLKIALRGQDLARDSFLTVPLFKQIFDSGDAGYWREMLAQSNLPLVALGGYYAIAEHNDETVAFGAALRVMMQRPADVPLAIYVPPLRVLSRAVANEGTLGVFQTWSVAGGADDDERFGQLLTLMPKPFLQAWYQRPAAQSLRPTREAYVLADLLAAVAAGKLQETDQMRARLWALRNYPGLPRYVYVMHVSPSSADFDRYLTLLLASEQITGVKSADAAFWQLCARRYREPIEALLAKEGALPANRKTALRLLLQTEKNKSR